MTTSYEVPGETQVTAVSNQTKDPALDSLCSCRLLLLLPLVFW